MAISLSPTPFRPSWPTLNSNCRITSASASVISPLRATLPFTEMANDTSPFCPVPALVESRAFRARMVACVLPQVPLPSRVLTRYVRHLLTVSGENCLFFRMASTARAVVSTVSPSPRA